MPYATVMELELIIIIYIINLMRFTVDLFTKISLNSFHEFILWLISDC